MSITQGTLAVIGGRGKYHTTGDPSNPLAWLTLDQIRALVDFPVSREKHKAPWIIPSNFASRTHAEQERFGQFYYLWADIDRDSAGVEQIAAFISDLTAGSDYEIYTTASATAENPKCRILIPVLFPLTGATWRLCQEILNDWLEGAGINPDRASEGCGQLLYLPNRGSFYASKSNRQNVHFNPAIAWKHQIDDKLAAAALLKVSRAPISPIFAAEGSPIRNFNQKYRIEEVLLAAGYDPHPRDPRRFRHPNSESGSYSATVRNGRVHSLSPNDPLYTGASGGGAHDAFSAFCVLNHAGDIRAALHHSGSNHIIPRNASSRQQPQYPMTGARYGA